MDFSLLVPLSGVKADRTTNGKNIDCQGATNRYNRSSRGDNNPSIIEKLGLKPRRSRLALPSNISTFTEYMLKCSPWKKPIGFDFTPHQNKSRYCGALWSV
ncbi:MAG: hypothetical protein EWV91_01430 [Microcystis aeruginosa Ma_QC_Ca_00000000_S207]|uniref:Uncharacterized protein n=1 Tax=Microcystis aeruginosa Ma_QC_Ca_00000000_S207 TaxID=2486251 RepID=A0A552G3T4_MICAE|nr:MAG: hypothetical protein EWV91_01430 [Microcystis aeruginosa Ma_QC_Ca_00000000_S207]